jgi:cytochrome c5
MKLTNNAVVAALAAFAALLLVATIAAGCTATSGASTLTSKNGQAGVQQGSDLSGSLLWAQMCGYCHNAPSPKDYSDAHWEVAVMHMRVQARLTGEEERKIVQFLKASN